LKTSLKAFCVLVLAAALAHAGDEKDLKKAIEENSIYVETAQKGIVLSGYVDTSYTYQFAGGSRTPSLSAQGLSGGGTTTREGAQFGTAPSTEAAFRAFDQNANSFQVNAFKLALEKPLPDENKWAAGFRADIMYGQDARNLNLRDTNGARFSTTVNEVPTDFNLGEDIFLEQAYVQFRAPVGNGLDFKVGRFVSLMGYEVIESPANLNFSRGLLFSNAIPLTHTGVMGSYKFNDTVDTQFGLVDGWDNSAANTSGIQGFPFAVTGRINVTAPGKNANISNAVIYSVDGEPGTASEAFNENESVFLWDMWGNWSPKFADDKLLLGFNTDLGFADKAQKDAFLSEEGTPVVADRSSTWMGVALYAKYQFTKLFSLAGRLEYLHGDNSLKFYRDRTNPTPVFVGATGVPGTNAPFNPNPGADPDVYSWTLTAGFNIWENLLTRIEYRYDWSTDTYINGTDQHQVALNLVYTF
jgi:Putative beta-barrel porin-2, OmpL-like. bbp2